MKPWMIYAAIAVVAIAVGFGLARFLDKRNEKGEPSRNRATGLNPEPEKS